MLDGVHRNPHYAAAVATAVNDWLRDAFLERDERLRASLVVSTLDIPAAVEEIERRAEDERFVQVLLPVRSDVPYGNRLYHPLYEAAERHGLRIALHAWGRAGTAPTTTGLATTYLEDYSSNAHVAEAQLISLVAEGVFERFPELGVVFAECGFAWLPSLLWRFDKDWKGVWREVPWVKRRPSEYVREHVRFTTAPAHLPASPDEAAEVLEMVGSELLLYASDAPHDHGASGEGAARLRRDPARQRRRLLPTGRGVKVVVARVQDFQPGERRIVKAGARSIGVFRVEDEFFAIRNRCPHQGGPLCEGRLSPWAVANGPGDVRMEGPPRLVACPWHGWEYDLETGQSFMGPGETRVKAYDVVVERGSELGEAAQASGREPGPYVAETFSVYVEEDYVVVDV